jgi:predicted RNase H-related nuclease YkuK (DUF458 family)
MFTEKEKLEIIDYLIETPGKVYLGGDSKRFKKGGKWYARYTCVFIVHINDKNGGKIFSFSETEPVYDQKDDKPRMRLMTEVRKIVDMYLEFGELLEDREVQIHLDINSEPQHNSSIVVKEALGYVLGMTGISAQVKPESWAAAHAADHFVRGKHL